MTTFCKKCSKEAPEGAVFCPYCGKSFVKAPKKSKGTRRSNNTGSAIQEANGSWTAVIPLGSFSEVDENGIPRLRRIRKRKRGFKTKTEALSYAQTHALSTAKKATPKLGEIYDAWYAANKDNLKGARVSANNKARERLKDLMGCEIDKISVKMIQNCIDRTCTSFDTAKDCKTLLSKLYKYAAIDDVTVTNKAQYIQLPKPNESTAQSFTSDDIQKLWNAWLDGDRFMPGILLLMIHTGIMPGEVLSMRRDQINLDACEIYGCGLKTEKRKSTSIIFPELLRPVIEALLNRESEGGRKSDKVIRMNKDNFYKLYHDTVARYDLSDIKLYSTRHTTASMQAAANTNAPTIQEIMRHAKITTTQRYIHNMSDAAHAAVNSIAAANLPIDPSLISGALTQKPESAEI